MDKLNFKTPNGLDVNLEKLSQLFPEAITETKDENGNIKRVANLDVLKTLLNGYVADPNDVECYEFTWPGKREAIMEAAKSTTKTLRPCPEESKNWDTTQNLYIEGDNLEVLKLLQESYLGKVKMIYIDPPYNTGKDFVYRDNFNKTQSENQEDQTVRDEETDNNLFQNTESNGRFHSDWCSMIYPRLKLARDLLSDDGVIFISIDDNELTNLKKICDEIFGESNFVAQITLSTGASQNGDGVKIQKNVEYCLVYANSQSEYNPLKVDKAEENLRNLNDAPTALYTRLDMGYTIYYNPSTNDMIPIMDYDKSKVQTNDIKQVYSDDKNLISKGYYPIRPGIKNNQLHRWRWGLDTFVERKNEIIIRKKEKEYIPYFKQSGYLPPKNLLTYGIGTSELKELFDNNRFFDFPKSTKYLKYILSFNTKDTDIVLDFFSGSATTAHACMQLNAEDGGNRKFIMVQLPEICAPESEAAKAGYKNICEIGKERIRRAGEKIKAEHATTAPNLDIGFRVLKLDESNMKEVYYKPDELSQDMLSGLESNIKEDRNDLDLLYACLIDWGVELALPLKTEEINGVKVYTVNDSEIPDLIACFSENIPETTIREIAKRKPLRVVFRDSSFAKSTSPKSSKHSRQTQRLRYYNLHENDLKLYNKYLEFIGFSF